MRVGVTSQRAGGAGLCGVAAGPESVISFVLWVMSKTNMADPGLGSGSGLVGWWVGTCWPDPGKSPFGGPQKGDFGDLSKTKQLLYYSLYNNLHLLARSWETMFGGPPKGVLGACPTKAISLLQYLLELALVGQILGNL